MLPFLQTFGIVAGAVFTLAVLLTLLPYLGRVGRAASDVCARPPLLDVVLALLTFVPWIVAAAMRGWTGLGAAIVGQMAAMYAWIFVHELFHLRAARGPRIVRFTNRLVGRPANHLALWATAIGVPTLWLVRFLEIFCYPVLVWLLRFPRYDHADWVTFSRHKFRDLVGHDLVWCLYCDWMTGTWSLGTEMLRNVESFWCPIRFAHIAKLENCANVFPDIDGGWAPANAAMAQVVAVLDEKYAGDGDRSWFGHRSRLTTTATGDVEEFEETLRESLADHSRRPRNCRSMDDATHQAEGELPLCNDRVRVFLRIEDGTIAEASFTATACPICTASASMMTGALKGRSEAESRRLFESFHDLMTRPDGSTSGDGLGDLHALAGVHRFPARVKCATLPWHTMMAAMKHPAASVPA
jgi:SUF system NifU family Fe-S assembly protein